MKTAKLLASWLLVLLLSSCSATELATRAFVVGIAIDAEGDKFSVTLSVADVEAIRDQSDDEELETLLKSENTCLATAMHNLNASISQSAFFGHAKVLVLGEGLLKSPKMLERALNTLRLNSEINQRITVLAAETAGEVLDYEKHKKPFVTFFIQNYFDNNNSAPPRIHLDGLITKMTDGDTAVIPKITIADEDTESKKIEISGTAVVKEYRFRGWLSAEESAGLAWFMGDVGGAIISTGKTALQVTRVSRRLSFVEKDGALKLTANLNVTGRLLTCQPSAEPQAQALKNELTNEIKQTLHKTFDALYGEKKADGLTLANLLRRQNKQLYERHADMAGVGLDVTVRLRVLD